MTKEIVADKPRVPAKMGRAYMPADTAAKAGDLMSVIRAAALDPRCDVAKMRELLNMAKEIEADESKKAFTSAFISLQAHLPSIGRDGKIEIREKDQAGQRSGRVQQATPYATFNAIHKVIHPILLEHGFGLSFSTEPSPDGQRILIKTMLDHIGGHQRSTVFPLPAEVSGSKNNVQGWGSSMSYGKRYGTIALLNIVSHAVEDADTDGHQGDFKKAKGGGVTEAPPAKPKVSPAQCHEINALLEWSGITAQNFCSHYGITVVDDLPAELFSAAEKEIKEHKAKRDANAQDKNRK